MKFQISKLPYAVLIDESGTIRAKGLVNSREQLESLFTAKELGVASVQEFWPPARPWTRPAFRARRTAMHWLDKLGERAARSVAHATSRRSVLNRIGRLFVGAAFIMPVLPVARAAPAAAAKKPQTDETACDYWRYCAVDGFLCSCCGGSMTSCPPGTSPSAVSWVGTCHNPLDGKDYLISYNDCCGKTACGKCMCAAAERERPGYQMFLHNDVNWCMSNESSIFHCTTSVIVGLAKPKP